MPAMAVGRNDDTATNVAKLSLACFWAEHRGHAGMQEATLISGIVRYAIVASLLCAGSACPAQSTRSQIARPGPPEDILDQYRATADTTAERLKALDETIAKAKQAFDIGTGIITDWKNVATDFEAYMVTTENAAAQCHEISDDLAKRRPRTFNRSTIEDLESMLAECEANVKKRIFQVARFKEILRRGEQEIISLVTERRDIDALRIKGASADKEVVLAERKIAEGIKKVIDDGRKALPDNRGF
jgi:hypothetical protein